MSQTLASGAPLAASYGKYGSTGSTWAPGLDRIFAMLVGYPGSGKTRLLESNPGALVLNFDLSRTKDNVEAQVLPVLNRDGSAIGPSGEAFTWTWDALDTIRKNLISAKASNSPRPTTIVFDGLRALMRIAESKWGTAYTAYGDIYDGITELALSLREAGYGVWLVSHVQPVKVKAKGAQLGDPPDLIDQITHSDKLHTRLFPFCELAALCFTEPFLEQVNTPKMATVSGKEVQVGTTITSVKSLKYFITAQPQMVPGVLKPRAKLPDRFELPAEGAWRAFETVYNASV